MRGIPPHGDQLEIKIGFVCLDDKVTGRVMPAGDLLESCDIIVIGQDSGCLPIDLNLLAP